MSQGQRKNQKHKESKGQRKNQKHKESKGQKNQKHKYCEISRLPKKHDIEWASLWDAESDERSSTSFPSFLLHETFRHGKCIEKHARLEQSLHLFWIKWRINPVDESQPVTLWILIGEREKERERGETLTGRVKVLPTKCSMIHSFTSLGKLRFLDHEMITFVVPQQ